MRSGIAEITGIFFVLVGLTAIVSAAAMVSVALAVLVCGVLVTFAGVLTIYVALVLERAGKQLTP